MHIKDQAKTITEKVSSAKQSAGLLVKHAEKLGLNEQAVELASEIHADLVMATTAIRGE